MAMGEKVVAAGGPPARDVILRARLSIQQRILMRYERARQLIDEATAATQGWRFRTLNDGGETGYQRRYALHLLYRAECQLTLELRQTEAARGWCTRSLAEARRAGELARFGPGQAAAASLEVDGELDFARLERTAGRHNAAWARVSAAGRLIEQHRVDAETQAYHLRVGSIVAQESGDHASAAQLARQAIATLAQQGLHPASVPVMVAHEALQRALVGAQDWPEALAAFERVESLLAAHPGSRSRTNLLSQALILAHSGRLARLASRLEGGAAAWQARLGPEHPQTAVLRGLHGLALLAGSTDPGTQAQGRARLAEASSLLLEAQRRNDSFLEGSIEALAARYVLEQFLHRQRAGAAGPNEFALSFQVADALRGSKVQAAIQDAALRLASGAPGLKALVQREQALREEIRALTELLSGRLAEGLVKERERLTGLQDERAQLRSRISIGHPAFAALINPRAPTPEDVVRRLAVGELFVLLLPVDDGVHVWSLSWTEQQHRFLALPTVRLTKAVASIRASTDFGEKLQPYALEDARWLGTQLLGPLQASIRQARHVVVAAGGALGTVPFAALPTGAAGEDGEPWLIRRAAVSQVPSASAWLAIQRLALTERPQGALMAWGDPVFDTRVAAAAPTGTTRRVVNARSASLDTASLPKYSDLPALPETRDELLAIASSVKAEPARDLVLGAQATRASVLAANQRGDLATRRVVAFATHGLMAGDLPNLNQPALALAATPDAETNPLAPLLTLDDVLGLRLNADWVVLSACNTAAADGRAEEALSGLARGFFYAGARSVLVTHWAVETESAKLLTTRTFEHYTANPYAGKAESLRQAMLSVMAMPKYQHPAFWAPYALVGDGAR